MPSPNWKRRRALVAQLPRVSFGGNAVPTYWQLKARQYIICWPVQHVIYGNQPEQQKSCYQLPTASPCNAACLCSVPLLISRTQTIVWSRCLLAQDCRGPHHLFASSRRRGPHRGTRAFVTAVSVIERASVCGYTSGPGETVIAAPS